MLFRSRLEDERARREVEQLAELVELARLEEEENHRVEEQRRREAEEKRHAEELRLAREKEEAELRKKAEDMRLVADDIEMHDVEASAEKLAEPEAGSSYLAKDGDCINCKVKKQECIQPR